MDNQDSLARYVPLGLKRPAHATGLGKALLAYLPEDELAAFLARTTLTRLTANTIIDRALLLRDLAETRERGFSIDRQEVNESVFCTGAPIFDYTGRAVAAVSVAGPPGRIAPRLSELARHVTATALAVSRRFGFRTAEELPLPDIGIGPAAGYIRGA